MNRLGLKCKFESDDEALIDDAEIGMDEQHERRDAERLLREQEQRGKEGERRKNILRYQASRPATCLQGALPKPPWLFRH